MSRTETFLFYLVEDFTHMALSCAVDPLRLANWVTGETLYEWRFASADGRVARASDGVEVNVQHRFDDRVKSDRLFVISGINMRDHASRDLLAALRRERSHGARIGALCSGAYVLALAGFLDGQRAALHWEYHDSFMERFPDVNLVRNVFVADERNITASGGTATADLMLHIIGQTHGEALADAIADQMVYNAVREASAEQKVSLQARHGMRNPHLARAIARMSETVEDPVQTSEIAEEVGISTRQLERLFGRYLNCSPSKYYLELRLNKARNLLLQSESSVTQVAVACGFKSVTHFARVYRGSFGVSPGEQRSRIS